ncbi:MAG: DUF4388 domain-containing protein [Candidatus Aminicenantes bacterium]|nr:DUF4388 domain-containing protein [Candidatus Aminicenantes bacterium]
MEQIWLHGDLKDLHFTSLLSRIWKSGGTGHLEIIKKDSEKRLNFHEGNIAIIKEAIDGKLFLTFLNEKKMLGKASPAKIKASAIGQKHFFLQELIEQGLLSPVQLWDCMVDYQKEILFPVFDWVQAEYFFDPEKPVRKHDTLTHISTPAFILQGTRQMKNDMLIRSLSPGDNKILQRLIPDTAGHLALAPHEEYILTLIESQKIVKNLYALSMLGERETRKTILGLLSLGIIGFPEKNRSANTPPEITKSEIFRIMDAFNEKCSYIFKYISKEIGPVALNILEKGLEDTKPLVSPLFSKITLCPDGKIEANSIIKSGIALSGEEIKVQLLRGLNEILVALVLAVKKTLGNEHEGILVKNLKKIGG